MSTSNIEFLAYESSPIGMIGLRRRELLSDPGTVVTEITLDHTLLMSSANSASEQALATAALALHEGEDLRVLVGGLGLGYTAHEVLRADRVAHVEVVEFLPQVIDWLDQGFLPLSESLKADARFEVVAGDVYGRLLQSPERRHDLILVDVDHSPDETLGAESESFYTQAGLERTKQHLAPGGVLGVWSYAESPSFEETLRRVFGEVCVEPVHFRNRILDEEETNWIYAARG